MILWSQQYRIITNVFNSFHSNEKKNDENPFSHKDLERGKLFLRPEKFQDYILANFKILVIYNMFKRMPSSKINFLKDLNSLKKEDIIEFRKFKSDVLSFNYIIDKDIKTLETLELSPYNAYKEGYINVLTLGYLGDNTKGIIAKKEIEKARMLVKFFNLRKN